MINSEEIFSRLDHIESEIGTHSDDLKSLDDVRKEVVVLKKAIHDLAEAMNTLPKIFESHSRVFMGRTTPIISFENLIKCALEATK